MERDCISFTLRVSRPIRETCRKCVRTAAAVAKFQNNLACKSVRHGAERAFDYSREPEVVRDTEIGRGKRGAIDHGNALRMSLDSSNYIFWIRNNIDKNNNNNININNNNTPNILQPGMP